MIHFTVARIDERSIRDLDINILSKPRQQRVAAARTERDKVRLALSETLVRDAVKATLGLPDSEIVFELGQLGKPFIVGKPEFHYNVSHSGHYVVCAYGHKPVGVDIQEKRPHDMRVAKRYFADEESAALESISDPIAQRDLFFDLWVRKEAYAKLLGVSVFEMLGVCVDGGGTPDQVGDDSSHKLGNGVEFTPVSIHSDYAGAICIRRQL